MDRLGRVPPLLRPSDSAAEDQRLGLERVRRGRDEAAVEAALARIDEACRGEGGLMEPILEAVECYATLGEIAGRWTAAWGRFRESF